MTLRFSMEFFRVKVGSSGEMNRMLVEAEEGTMAKVSRGDIFNASGRKMKFEED
jgi:hypothetical protein